MSATEYRHPGLTLEQRVKAYLDSPIGAPVTRGLVIDLMAELTAARAGVVAEEPEWEYAYAARVGVGGIEYVDISLSAHLYDDRGMPPLARRRSAGPWVPVKQGAES